MGTEANVIALLPGENPYDAMSRTYGFDASPDEDRGVPPAVPPNAFPGWQETVTERIEALCDWGHEYDPALHTHRFASPTFGWIIHVEPGGVTLTMKRSWDLNEGPAPTEADFLAVFADLDCILVRPNLESWVHLNSGETPTEIWPE